MKEKGNAFCGTDLDERLRSLGVDTVIFAGFCAEFCVLILVPRSPRSRLFLHSSPGGIGEHLSREHSFCGACERTHLLRSARKGFERYSG